MQLLQLPEELLDNVLRQSIPVTFEGLALSCKHLHRIAKPYLPDHQLLRNFRHFGYQNQSRGVHGHRISYAWQLLYNIAMEPRIAHVLEVADLREGSQTRAGTYVPGRLIRLQGEWQGLQESEIRETLRVLLAQHKEFWEEADIDQQDLLDLIFDDDFTSTRGTASTVLLALLPNLHTLALGGRWSVLLGNPVTDTGIMMRKILEGIVRRANSTSTPKPSASLSKLREILPHANGGQYQDLCAINSYESFFALPSLRTAKITACTWRSPESLNQIVFRHDLYPGIRSLTLESSSLRARELHGLISRMPELESLTLNYDQDDGSAKKVGWTIGKLVADLGDAVGAHLKSLTIRTPDWPERIGSQPEDFSKFTSLQDLEVDLNIFHPFDAKALFSAMQVGDAGDAGDENANEVHGAGSKAKAKTPHLPFIEMLPSTIQHVRLRVRRSSPYVFDSARFPDLLKTLFEGLGDRRDGVLPQLQVVELWHCDLTRRFRGFEGVVLKFDETVEQIASEIADVQIVHEPGFQEALQEHEYPAWYSAEHGWAHERAPS